MALTLLRFILEVFHHIHIRWGEPEGECGHINQITTAHVTCVTGPMTINLVNAINCKILTLCYYNFIFIQTQ